MTKKILTLKNLRIVFTKITEETLKGKFYKIIVENGNSEYCIQRAREELSWYVNGRSTLSPFCLITTIALLFIATIKLVIEHESIQTKNT